MDIKLILLLALLPMTARGQCGPKPNIVVILADDMGWGDVSWSNESQLSTPNLEVLKQEGVELAQFYSQPKCTAARAALMTGRYPYRMGLQTNDVFSRARKNFLDTSYKLMPNYMKDAGYSTHIVGKWHLGHCKYEATPLGRGFDSFFGAWGNTKDYFHHSPKAGTYEWIENNEPYWEGNGTYNTFLITNRSVDILNDHFSSNDTKDKPIFLYVPYLAPHKPAQVPKQYRQIPECARITNGRRRTYCGMVAALDEGVGRIVDTLRQNGVLDNTIVLFTSDNGAAINVGADSWPLRGNKQTIYEGGTRVRTILRAPQCFPKLTGEYNGLIHVTDLLPTFIEATGANLPIEGDIDGISAYQSLVSASPYTNREWMVYNIDHERGLAAIRFKNCAHDFKLVYHNNTWTNGWRSGDPRCKMNLPTCDKTIKRWYRTRGNPYRLFDMKTNPEEREPSDKFPDAAEQYPEFFNLMVTKLEEFNAQLMPVIKYDFIRQSDKSRPKFNNGFWVVGGC